MSETNPPCNHIDELPEEAMLEILTGLDSSTCFSFHSVERGWRDLWKKVPKLEFNISNPLSSNEDQKNRDFVSGFLRGNRENVVREIKLKCDAFSPPVEEVDSWLSKMSERRGVQSIDFVLPRNCSLPRTFHFQNFLVELRLENVTVEDEVRFPNLQRLSLKNLRLTVIGSWISGSPNLKKLSLTMDESEWFCSDKGDININSKSLSSLDLHFGFFREYRVLITAQDLAFLTISDRSSCSYTIHRIGPSVNASLVMEDNGRHALIQQINTAKAATVMT